MGTTITERQEAFLPLLVEMRLSMVLGSSRAVKPTIVRTHLLAGDFRNRVD